MKNIISILLLGLLVFSCRHKESKKEFGGEYIGANFRTHPEITLGEIIKYVKYVALETDFLCLIQELQQVKFVNDTLFILDKENLFTFTGEGKFVAKIGNKGRSVVNFLLYPVTLSQGSDSVPLCVESFLNQIMEYRNHEFVMKYVVETIEPVVDIERVQMLSSSSSNYFDLFDNIRESKKSVGIKNVFESTNYVLLFIGGGNKRHVHPTVKRQRFCCGSESYFGRG